MARPFGTLKYDNLEDLENGIEEYFVHCDETNRPYTIEGLSLSLDITPQTLCNYAKTEDYFDAVNRARLRCLAYKAERLYDKDGVQGAKFDLVNNSARMGGLQYADKQEVSVTGDVVFTGEDDLR